MFPTHPRAGTNSDRQSVGDPGHCETCAEVGHVAAHPDLGCGDVGCEDGHDDTSTYFLVTTVDADNPEDAIAIARDLDEPTEVPTIAELGKRISTELIRYASEIRNEPDFAARVTITEAYEARIIEIVTLGNVPRLSRLHSR